MEATVFSNLCQQILTLSRYQVSHGWLIGYSLESFPCRKGTYLEATVGYKNFQGDYIHLGEIQYEDGLWFNVGPDRVTRKQSENIDEVIQSMLIEYNSKAVF